MPKWLERYILLVLRISKAVQARTQDILHDFYGPRRLREQVAKEEVWPAERLLREAAALMNDLPSQDFAVHRSAHLSKQLTALETICRRLGGAEFSLSEEAWRYFGLDVQWIPESIFEEALALYEKALPGKGSIPERLAYYHQHYRLPAERARLLPELMQRAVRETRMRTDRIIALPGDDRVEICPITDKPVKAMAQYLGNYRSNVFVNTGIPFNISELLSVVSHEGYPGHIAEFILKEEYMAKQKNYYEQQVGFLLTPPYVVSEGMALLALESIFAPGEAEQWMVEHIYSDLGIEAEAMNLPAIQRATDLLRGVWCNAAFLLQEKQPVSEAVRYIMKYTLCDEEKAQRAVLSLQRPFCESYIFTYYYGRMLVEPMLSGPNGRKNLKRLLTEQMTPSDLDQKL